MKKILLPTLFSLSFAALAAEPVANGLTYNHIGVAYGVIEFDDKSSAFKSKGYGLEASNLVTENIFIFGSFSDTKSNKAKNNGANVSMDVDFKNYSFGAGYRIPLAKGTDAYAAISGVKSKGRFNAQGESSSDSSSGVEMDVGVKTLLSESVELTAGGGMLLGDFMAEARLQYKLAPSAGLFAGYSRARDSNAFIVGLRYLY